MRTLCSIASGDIALDVTQIDFFVFDTQQITKYVVVMLAEERRRTNI